MSGTRVSRHLKRFSSMSLEDEIRACISILIFVITLWLSKSSFPHAATSMIILFSAWVMLIPLWYFFVLDNMNPEQFLPQKS